MLMKLGVLSDTHGLLRQEVLNHLQGCDAILHGGDINNQGICIPVRPEDRYNGGMYRL